MENPPIGNGSAALEETAMEKAIKNERDAARYRWIREATYTQTKKLIKWTGGSPYVVCGAELDAIIDAAIGRN